MATQNATTRIFDTSKLASGDPNIRVPDSVHELASGGWLACHDGEPDTEYATLADLQTAYRIRVHDATPEVRRIHINLQGKTTQIPDEVYERSDGAWVAVFFPQHRFPCTSVFWSKADLEQTYQLSHPL